METANVGARTAAQAGLGAPEAPALSGRIPSLDGLRTISILAVLVGHSVDTYGGPGFLGPLRHMGNLGVRMFFVISGFLITTLLLKELARRGNISLRDFYIRRTLRIWPAFFLCVGVVAVLHALGYVKLNAGDILHSVTFTMNYHHDQAWALNHLWSLAVEEQFYLLWPALLVFLGVRRAAIAAAVMLLVSPLCRVVMWYGIGVEDVASMTREFQAVADSLAVGCLCSCYYNRITGEVTAGSFMRSLAAPAVGALLLVVSFASYFAAKAAFYVFAQSLANMGLALIVVHTVSSPHGLIGRALNNTIATVIGTLSYSLYLWQNLFLNPDSNHWFTRFPTNLALTFMAAAVCYALVERPFLAMRHRFSA